MNKYTVEIGGSSWARGPVLEAGSLTAARADIKSYGTTADWGTISKGGAVVERWRRDTNGRGMRWFRSE